MGYDARIGFGFEKKRCSKRCLNKFVYFWEGCKKNCCRKTVKLDKLIDGFYKVAMDDDENHQEHEHADLTAREDRGKLEAIFKTKKHKSQICI
jgi:hypothetical protein